MSLADVVITGNRTGNGGDVNTGFQGGFGGSGGGIHSSGTLTMTDCVVSNNSTGNGGANTASGSSSGGWGGFGGGIYHATGSLTMTDCVISNNSTGNGNTGGSGGSGGRGAGIFLGSATLTLNRVAITGNRTGDSGGPTGGNSGYGGGIFSDGPNAFLNLTNLTITNNTTGNTNSRGDVGGGAGMYILAGTGSLTASTISNNHNGDSAISSGAFGGGGFGAGIFNNGNLTVTNSLISGNSTGDGNLGSSNAGGGIVNNFILTLINTTVSGNSAGAGANRGGGISNGGTLRLTNCTVTGNMANNFNIGNGIVGGPSTTVRNSIIAGNGPGGNGPDLNPGFGGDAFHSQGNNIIGNGESSTGFTAPGDQVGTGAAPINPLLGPLADNGGPTLTHALLDGSTGLDAGADCVTQPAHCGDANLPQLTTDQRGTGFSRIVDGPDGNTTATVDIGAYERQQLFPDLADTSGNEDTAVVVAFEVLDSGSITSVTATSSNPTLVPNNPANISGSGSGSNRAVTINPTANLSGATDITVTVNRTSGSTSETLTLTINPVNDAPSFTKGSDQSVNENAGAQSISNWATGLSVGPADEAAQTPSFQITGNTNTALFSAAPAISPTGTLTFTPAAGVSGSATITAALMDNGGTTNGGVDTSPTQTFTINVLDGGALHFNSSTFGQNESSSSVLITVVRSGGSAGEARVDYATSDGTATAGLDYTATSGTLTFPDGVTSRTFTVSILNDTLDETTEIVTLKLTNVAGSGSLGAPSQVGLSIIDDDPTPSLRINDVSVTEGDSGTINAVFTVTLSAASSFTVTAGFVTADGTAITPGDYQHNLGQVILNPGELTKTINVTVNGDTVPEVHESFVVNLSNATSSFLSDSQGVGTILSDDAPGGTFAFNVLHDSVDENSGFKTIVVNRSGDTSAAVNVNYATSDGTASLVPCFTSNGLASARCDFTTALGTLRFSGGDASKSFVVLINQDVYVEGPEALTLTLSNPTGGAVLGGSSSAVSGSLTIVDDLTEPASNPIDTADAFVRQHYHDFLNRETDAGGLEFWKNEILNCGTDQQCIELKRTNVSAAFYLSIEFQETGYLVERMYKVSYGNAVGTSVLGGFHQFPVPVIRLNEFLADTQEIGLGVVVGLPGWEQALENNKQLFADRFVLRSRFTATNAFPTTMTASQFVDKLNSNAGGVLLANERTQLINQLETGAKTRAQVMRTIAEDPDLVIAEQNRAFVLMQYFGYLRRNPNDSPDSNHTGYEFWLSKLNQFEGNYINAEMVKAFISSIEYRQRFAQ